MNQLQLAQMLTQHGVRPTQQRLAVFDYLLQHRVHPSAETVYEALVEQYPTFSRTTVYNSLHALVAAGLVLELALGTEQRHYDADVSLHGHFHCRRCGSITDIPLEEGTALALQPAGFQVDVYNLSFTGLCPRCGQDRQKVQ